MLVSFRGARGRASCYGDVTLDDGNGNIAEFKIKEPAYLTEAGSFFCMTTVGNWRRNSMRHTGAVKILLADDHPLVLESVRKLLEPYFSMVDMVHNSAEIMPRALVYQPDVILLDACMPGLNGFAATR